MMLHSLLFLAACVLSPSLETVSGEESGPQILMDRSAQPKRSATRMIVSATCTFLCS